MGWASLPVQSQLPSEACYYWSCWLAAVDSIWPWKSEREQERTCLLYGTRSGWQVYKEPGLLHRENELANAFLTPNQATRKQNLGFLRISACVITGT
jgi:hypothetical protein